jgi:DNA invertase Pin-like site-specific DNA recombinase
VARQIEACRELGISRGWHIVAEVTDNDVSALRGVYRSGHEEVLRLVRDGHLDYVVCWQTSRLLRKRRERADAIELFGRQRVGIIAVKGISFDLTSAYGRGQGWSHGGVRHDGIRGEGRTWVTASAVQRAQAGRPSGDLGYGWIVEGTGSSATYREDPHQAGVVREIVNRLLSGETLRSITQSLNNAAGLDQFVRDVVIERLSRPDALAWLMGDEKEAGLITDRITELSDLLKEAADDYAAKRITRPVFLRLCENYQTDLDAAEEELRRVGGHASAGPPNLMGWIHGGAEGVKPGRRGCSLCLGAGRDDLAVLHGVGNREVPV